MCASINKWVKYSQRISIITTKVAIGGDMCKKGVLKNFAKFTGKHASQSLLFNKAAGWDLQLY